MWHNIKLTFYRQNPTMPGDKKKALVYDIGINTEIPSNIVNTMGTVFSFVLSLQLYIKHIMLHPDYQFIIKQYSHTLANIDTVSLLICQLCRRPFEPRGLPVPIHWWNNNCRRHFHNRVQQTIRHNHRNHRIRPLWHYCKY